MYPILLPAWRTDVRKPDLPLGSSGSEGSEQAAEGRPRARGPWLRFWRGTYIGMA